MDADEENSLEVEELISQFVDILLEMGEKKYKAAVERFEYFEYIFDQLEQLKVQEMDHLEEANSAADNFLDDDDDVEMDNDDNVKSEGMKRLEELHKRFEAYCKGLVVFGFNSAGYDIKLIKKQLFQELCEHGQQPTFTVKKSRKYPCIKTEHLKFLDVLQFLAPGYNLLSFFKAFGVTKQKGFFPYDYFTHADQLDETTLLPYETFYSTIKNCNVLEEEYISFQNLSIKGSQNKKPFKYCV